jgi:hypothetical protein
MVGNCALFSPNQAALASTNLAIMDREKPSQPARGFSIYLLFHRMTEPYDPHCQN